MTASRAWHSHYPEEINVHMAYEESALQDFLIASQKNFPNKKALHFMGREWAFQEVYHQSCQMAAYLQSIGLEKGDRVAVMLPNCPQSVISYYATLMAGGIVVQTNPLYKERELAFQLKDSGATVIVCLDVLLPVVTKARKDTAIKHTIVTGIKDHLPFLKNIIYPFLQKKEYNMLISVEQTDDTHIWNAIFQHTTHRYRQVPVNPKEDLALLQYTGGTTGYPKGVMLTHYSLVSNVEMCRNWLYKLNHAEETILGALPFFHVYGMTTVMNLSIMMAAKMVLLPKFDPEEVFKTIEKQKPTLFPGAPTMYIGLLNHPDIHKYDLSSIKACISGSAPLPKEVQEQFEAITNGRLVEGYGLTETSPVTHANFLWGKRVDNSIGVPWPDTDCRILDTSSHEEVPVGEVGEIAIKGPQVMKGYWNNPQETEDTFHNGWLLTGDVGWMDQAGYFYVVDRKKDIIIAGGFNIYPREVEEVLYELVDIQEVVVAGIPDAYRGETVKAYIVLKEGSELTEEEANFFCRKNLAPFKAPHLYEFRDSLPKTTVGKILRRTLVAEDMKRHSDSDVDVT